MTESLSQFLLAPCNILRLILIWFADQLLYVQLNIVAICKQIYVSFRSNPLSWNLIIEIFMTKWVLTVLVQWCSILTLIFYLTEGRCNATHYHFSYKKSFRNDFRIAKLPKVRCVVKVKVVKVAKSRQLCHNKEKYLTPSN